MGDGHQGGHVRMSTGVFYVSDGSLPSTPETILFVMLTKLDLNTSKKVFKINKPEIE